MNIVIKTSKVEISAQDEMVFNATYTRRELSSIQEIVAALVEQAIILHNKTK